MKKSSSSKSYSSTQKQKGETPKTKKKNVSYSQGDKIVEDIDDILMDLSLKKPKTAYNFYLKEMMEKDKSVSNITEAAKKFSRKWSSLKASDKNKYEEMAEHDKERYENHLEIVRKHILQKPVKQDATAYRLYLEEHARRAIDNNEDPKQARKNAAAEWKEMKPEDRKEWNEKKKEHLEWFENVNKAASGPINSYALYNRDQMAEAREKGETMTFVEVAKKWKNCKQSVKDKYSRYAEEEKEEREKNRDLYEIAHGIKPRRPLGAYKFFLMEAVKEKKIPEGQSVFKQGAIMWKKLNDEQRDRYERIAQREKLAYAIKKMEYNTSIKKQSSTRPLTALNIFMQEMKDSKESYGKEGYFNFCYKKWNKMDEDARAKYYEKAEQSKKESNKMNESINQRVHIPPKKPLTSYNLFMREKVTKLREEDPSKPTTQCFKECGQMWSKMSDKQKEKYENMYAKLLEEYQVALNAYNEFGFYDGNENKTTAKKKRRQPSADPKEKTNSTLKKSKKTKA